MGSKNKESEEKDMARLSPAQAALFPSNGGRTNFLSLANDGDSAVIRFAYNSLDDIIVDTIHEVQDNEGKRNRSFPPRRKKKVYYSVTRSGNGTGPRSRRWWRPALPPQSG